MPIVEILGTCVWPAMVYAIYRSAVYRFGESIDIKLRQVRRVEQTKDGVSASFDTPISKIESEIVGIDNTSERPEAEKSIDPRERWPGRNPCEAICLRWDDVRQVIDDYGNVFLKDHDHGDGAVATLGRLRMKYKIPENEFRALIEMRHMRYNAACSKLQPVYSDAHAIRFSMAAERLMVSMNKRIELKKAGIEDQLFIPAEQCAAPIVGDPLVPYLQ